MAHGRLYEHLRDVTKEGHTPTLEGLAPLYQAIAHGCRAERYRCAFAKVYLGRICRNQLPDDRRFYAARALGAYGANLAAISWFFSNSFGNPHASLHGADRRWLINEAAYILRTQARFNEALLTQRIGLQLDVLDDDRSVLPAGALNLANIELTMGSLVEAVAAAKKAIELSDKNEVPTLSIASRAALGAALHAAGQRDEAERSFADAEYQQKRWRPNYPQLYAVEGYRFCELLLARRCWVAVRDRAGQSIRWPHTSLVGHALSVLMLGRAHLAFALESIRKYGLLDALSGWF